MIYGLKFTNANGVEYSFDTDDMFVHSLGGLNSSVMTNYVKSPSQIGDYYVGKTIERRNITIKFTLMKYTQTDFLTEKALLNACFNPSLSNLDPDDDEVGTLEFYIDGTKYSIQGRSTANLYAEEPPGKGEMDIKGQIIIECPYPYFRVGDLITVDMDYVTGGLTLPFTLPLTLGTRNPTYTITITGNVPSPFIFEVSGITDPKLVNQDAKKLEIERTILSTETLAIDTTFGVRTVEIDGVNSFQYLTTDSEFFYLYPGVNTLTYVDSGTVIGATAQLKYYNWVAGI
jgi:hypothetical protein